MVHTSSSQYTWPWPSRAYESCACARHVCPGCVRNRMHRVEHIVWTDCDAGQISIDVIHGPAPGGVAWAVACGWGGGESGCRSQRSPCARARVFGAFRCAKGKTISAVSTGGRRLCKLTGWF
eukprot:3061964-Prymnesium_polylepis.1